jgi:hypothetical protein
LVSANKTKIRIKEEYRHEISTIIRQSRVKTV